MSLFFKWAVNYNFLDLCWATVGGPKGPRLRVSSNPRDAVEIRYIVQGGLVGSILEIMCQALRGTRGVKMDKTGSLL